MLRELCIVVAVSVASLSDSLRGWLKEDPERGRTLGLSPKGAQRTRRELRVTPLWSLLEHEELARDECDSIGR